MSAKKNIINFALHTGVCKINCVTQYLSVQNSSVGERPAARGGTTRPDERQNENNLNLSPNFMGQCPKYCVNEKTGFRYNLLYLDSVERMG